MDNVEWPRKPLIAGMRLSGNGLRDQSESDFRADDDHAQLSSFIMARGPVEPGSTTPSTRPVSPGRPRSWPVRALRRPSPRRDASQGSGVFLTYPVLCGMRWQGRIAQVVGTGMPRRSCRSSRST